MSSSTCIYDTKYVYAILSKVHEMGEVMASDLEDLGGSWLTIDSRLSLLIDTGILETHERAKGRRVRLYSLTQAGERLHYLMSLGTRVVNGDYSFEDGSIIELVDNAIASCKENGNRRP